MTKEKEKRIDLARELLEAKLPVPTVARRLQNKFNIVRSTAYVDIREANDQIEADDDGTPQNEGIDTAGIIAGLLYDAQVCQEAGDFSSMTKCVNAANLLKQWGGSKGPEYRHRA
jgi:hypothetical protein